MSIKNQQILEKYTQPLTVTGVVSDINAPLSFKDWYSSRQGVIVNEEFKQYNSYLIEWYKSKKRESTDTSFNLKLNYLILLRQLQTFFSKEEAENWYNSIDINNEKELLLAIPYFARKLKDISNYFLQLRNATKNATIEYNQVGTNKGIFKVLQNQLLQNYTRSNSIPITLPYTIWKNIPELSAINDSITIQIEDLYDYQNYLDHSPTLPVSSYYDISEEELINFLKTKNIELTSTEWIYKLGTYELTSIPFELTNIPNNELTNLSLQPINLITNKYLGQTKFTSRTPIVSTQQDIFDIDIGEGNNYFFWPAGTYKTKIESAPRYQAVPLSSLDFSSIGTAGSSIDIADTIFVKTDTYLSGAWLYDQIFDFKTETMRSTIGANSKTVFRFPFPGFGLSAEGSVWSGYGLEYDPRFLYLDKQVQETIFNEYWSNNTSLTSIEPLTINNTTLINNKAYASTEYNFADKVRVRPVPPEYDNLSFFNTNKEAWLYRMNNTDISIQGNTDSTIYWPFEKIDSDGIFPKYFSTDNSSICRSVLIKDIDFSFSVAGSGQDVGDAIYRINNYKDTIEEAVECCWLSGSQIDIPEQNLVLTNQPGFQGEFKAGIFTRFIWLGPNDTDVNTIFKSKQHSSDCKYILNTRNTFLDFAECTCKQVLFTPFGHNGDSYTDNDSLTDFIVLDNFSPNAFDLNSWLDSNNRPYLESSEFTWFKTNTKIGWGDGQWVAGDILTDNSLTFKLKTGKPYIYYRSNVRTKDTTETTLPNLAIRHSYQNYKSKYGTDFSWIRSIKDQNNNWISTNTASEMSLRPGDLFIYSRKGTIQHSLTSAIFDKEYIQENRGSIWSNIDYLTINDETFQGKNQSFIVTYPVINYTTTAQSSIQEPSVPITQIISILRWDVTHRETNTTYTYQNTPSIVFSPKLTGHYDITGIALSSATFPPTTVLLTSTNLQTFFYTNTGTFVLNNIPSVTAISPDTITVTLTTFAKPVPGFVLNTPLQGWDYNTLRYNNNIIPVNTGARPYWGKSYIEKDEFTNFKSIAALGTPQRLVDEYNILTQPEFSDIELNVGDYFEYTRNYPIDLTWIQPLNFNIEINKKLWCHIDIQTENNNLDFVLKNTKTLLTPTTSQTPIILQNFVNNNPVEINYNAVNSFVWNISAVPEVTTTVYENITSSVGIEAVQPWANLGNQFFPTVAIFPNLNELYSSLETGGYSTPNNTGTSVYYDRNFSTSLVLSSSDIETYYDNPSFKVGGRGLTKQDQQSPYKITEEDNIWLKEQSTSLVLAGTVNKKVYKKHQKFLPYQSVTETNLNANIGLITPLSRQTPWGGVKDLEWTDFLNKPISFTGELDVEKWTTSQNLKQNRLQLDNWVTDIFGNQYGLYKNLKEISFNDRNNVSGDLWVRKNSQLVMSGNDALSGIYNSYYNTNLINLLTGSNINKIDVFFDTLMIQTTSVIFFEKINYDYTLDNIFSIIDDARHISLSLPVQNNINREFANINLNNGIFAKPGETWFFPEQKLVIISIVGLSGNLFYPELYSLDINNLNLQKVFPNTEDGSHLLAQQLSGINISEIKNSSLSFNPYKNLYTFSTHCNKTGQLSSVEDIIVELKINNLEILNTESITVYLPVPSNIPLLPPYIDQDLSITISPNQLFAFQCIAVNTPVTFKLISGPDNINIRQDGLIIGTSPNVSGTYYLEFVVQNSIGPTYYTLNITVI